ncbi:ABC transporter ATP-binding protein [Bacillus badius]|uniref:Hydroxymethylpyrimidine ABC transporter, ATPase component n=1 Tax=Bacillus badius TaxID=1455 RepID=A0ABR5B044_BACBA|nr:ABC transporter ATP-binding protein [Bacillus badius]KIL80345.1 Hydroxymethylpyrimidine ABC transporter, ATPase component [Bacillus badius]KZR56763.1 ABC transporter ATP-binding protein [Bacillus badius]MED4716890.1 ABC transporter ATP-binding protein [Bacillus badius]
MSKCGRERNKKVLQFENVAFSYHDKKQGRSVPVLQNINIDMYDREFIAIIGPSGSGKSTLFRLISGLENPDEGRIFINGEVQKCRLGKVGYMPQQDLLMPWRTVIENAALPLELKGVRKEEAHKQILPLLEEFGLRGMEHRFPHELSGGMKQRVSFLRTSLSGSNVLLLDEPFSALDAITRLSMQEWLMNQWEKRKATIVLVTHDVSEALFLADRIFIFTERPVRSLQEVNVPLGRPRRLNDLNEPAIISLKNDLIEQLRGKVIT